MKITIKSGIEIGKDRPTFIIAEVGSNWRTLEDCLHSIQQAKACGADAVKFQLYDYSSLYGTGDRRDLISGWMESEKVNRFSLQLQWLPTLKKAVDDVSIEFMCSAFSPELIEVVDPFVNLHKVASAELTHVRMLEKLRSIGKPVLLSTGASGLDDIKMALKTLSGEIHMDWNEYYGGVSTEVYGAGAPTILLYCVAAYPAQEIHLPVIRAMLTEFDTLVGYSDHSTDVLCIPKLAVEWGAVVIEKHFTAIEADTPDKPHSLNVDQFKKMVKSIRSTEPPRIGYTHEENPMILKHNRRLIATQDLCPGDTLKEGVNFGIYRSLKEDSHAYSPWLIDQVQGKVLVRAITAGDGIGPGDLSL
jgi:N,N'-diacetyllegionaminate synthase